LFVCTFIFVWTYVPLYFSGLMLLKFAIYAAEICIYVAKLCFTWFYRKLEPMEVEVKSGGGNTQWTTSQSTFV
jgi:hypothetical protein